MTLSVWFSKQTGEITEIRYSTMNIDCLPIFNVLATHSFLLIEHNVD